MLCINYNVYILCYLHNMVSTYYYIYIIVTYYVVNGINILDYLHNGNVDNGGHGLTMSPLCATVKGALYAYTVTLCGVPCELYATG